VDEIEKVAADAQRKTNLPDPMLVDAWGGERKSMGIPLFKLTFGLRPSRPSLV
jgi:hypothetical protein